VGIIVSCIFVGLRSKFDYFWQCRVETCSALLWDFGFSVTDAASREDKWGLYVHPCLNVITIQSFY